MARHGLTVVRDRCFTAGYRRFDFMSGPKDLAFQVAYPICTGASAYQVKVWREGNRSNVADREGWARTKGSGLSMARRLLREL